MGLRTVVGFQAKTYFNSGSYGSPTWEDCVNIKDNKLAMEKGEGDANIKGNGGWGATKGTLKNATIDFAFQYRKDASTGALPDDVQAFQDAWLNDDLIECLVLDGEIDVAGSQGLRAYYEVLKYERDEPVDGLMVINVSMKPGLGDHAPDWHVET